MSDLQKDRKPLLDKLEPRGEPNRERNGFNTEAKAWSKTGRDVAQFIMDIIKWVLD